jgi:urease accessory protein
MRGDRPFIMGSIKSGDGLKGIIEFIEKKGLLSS